MAMVTIDYEYNEDPKKVKYICIKLDHIITLNQDECKFDTGDFVKDWYALNKFIYYDSNLYLEPIMHSSSVDHFIMDTDKYWSKYLNLMNDTPILVENYDQDFLECFVYKETNPNWEEYKAYCLENKGV